MLLKGFKKEIFRAKCNCGDCGCPTCMVFAVQVREGGKGAKDCLPLDPESQQGLNSYLSQFKLDF